MLQKTEDIRLQRVLSRIETLKKQGEMRFPIAEIGEKTGFRSSQVSETLKGRISMSQKFYDSFVKNFGLDKKDNDSNEDVNINTDLEKYLGDMTGELINAKAKAEVALETLVYVLHQTTGKQVSLIRAELNEAISLTASQSLKELKKKH